MTTYVKNYSSWQSLNESTNGKLDVSTLTQIPVKVGEKPGYKLNSEAAAAYAAMVAAAAKEGISWGITGSYRTFEIQTLIFDWALFKATGKKRKKGTNGKVAAAYPGTSNHGWGSAVDIKVKKGDAAWNWFHKSPTPEVLALNPAAKTNAAVFGFTTLANDIEPWHWEHKGSAKKMQNGMPLAKTFPVGVAAVINNVVQNLQKPV